MVETGLASILGRLFKELRRELGGPVRTCRCWRVRLGDGFRRRGQARRGQALKRSDLDREQSWLRASDTSNPTKALALVRAALQDRNSLCGNLWFMDISSLSGREDHVASIEALATLD